jgi:cytoskeleton protein RodZ
MAVEAGVDVRGGIGARLRAGREKKGLTVLQAAEKLHVDAKILESLESDNFDALGAPVYARGHLRHYAEFVGESASQLNEIYSTSVRGGQPDLTRIPTKVPPSSESNPLIVPTLVVLGVFAVAGAVWWVLSLSEKKPSVSQTHVIDQTVPITPTDSSQPMILDDTAHPAVSGNTAQPAPRASSLAGAAAQSRAGRPQSTPAGVAAGSVGSSAGNPGAPAGSHSAAEEQVTLRFSADSWTEVYDAAGQQLFYDVGAANSVHTFKGAAPLRVVLGNASGVAVEVNGHGAPITKLSHPDGSAQFYINRSGHVARAQSPADGG